jgi:hypothetical protein
LNNSIAKTILGAGAGVLANKIFGGGSKTPSGGGTAGGTKQPVGGNSSKPQNPTSVITKPNVPSGPRTDNQIQAELDKDKLTDEQVQEELDRVKASEEPWTPPEGAIDNGDGTYTVIDGDLKITYNADGSTAGMESASGDVAEYTQDDKGNIYKIINDKPVLIRSAEVDEDITADGSGLTPKDGIDVTEGAITEGDYFADNDGNIYNSNGDLVQYADGTAPDTSNDDTVVADNLDPNADDTAVSIDDTLIAGGDDTGGDDFLYAGNDEFENQYEFGDGTEFAKRGGSIHQERKGGLPRFAKGNLVDETGSITDFAINDETGDLYKPLGTNESGDSYIPVLGSQGYVKSSNPTALSDLVEGDSSSFPSVANVDLTGGTDFTPTPGIQYFDDGSYIQTFDDGSTITVDSDGNIAGATDGYTTTGDDEGNTIVTDGYGNVTVYDPNGNVIPVGGGRETVKPITSVGSGKTKSYATQVAEQVKKNAPVASDDTGVLDALTGYITKNPGLASGAIGALLASMMDSSGESAGPSQPVDISALTSFAPRTTDFGPGMAGGRTGTGSTIVPYQDYDQGFDYEYTPDERLYSDLGISGYLNEPEMTDYTDEQGNPVDQYGNSLNDIEATEEPAMASGGPTTHYTFGRVINPAENLGLAQGMKKGGLSQAHTVHSHHTNPVVDERVDFRQGSAVNGAGDGQSDDIPAWLADGEYVMDAELVSMLGNGSNKAGAKVLDKFREEVRAHKRSAPLGKIPPKAKSPLNYIKESMNG